MNTAKPIARPTTTTAYVLTRINQFNQLEFDAVDVNRNMFYTDLNDVQKIQTLKALKGEYWHLYALELPLP